MHSALGFNHNLLPGTCRDELPKAGFKREYADFQVDEQLGFEPDGAGAHLWLNIRKSGRNTRDILSEISKELSVAEKDIGYSGLKDRRAVTTQWLSVPIAQSDDPPPAPEELPALAGVEYLRCVKSGRKLRSGAHRSNRFKIILRDIDTDKEGIERRLGSVNTRGFPNYFGAQRFGINGSNVEQAQRMFTSRRKLSRFKRGIYLSAARSWLFNQVLAKRIQSDNWLQLLPGEACILDGSNSLFHCPIPDAETQKRLELQDIHTSGPLYGSGISAATDSVLALESECLKDFDVLCKGLETNGLKAERRALRARAHQLQWRWIDQSTLEISVTLQRGVYATSLLSEIVVPIQQPETQPEAQPKEQPEQLTEKDA